MIGTFGAPAQMARPLSGTRVSKRTPMSPRSTATRKTSMSIILLRPMVHLQFRIWKASVMVYLETLSKSRSWTLLAQMID